MMVGIGWQLVFPPEIATTTLRPVLVLWCPSLKKVFIIKLTVPWEDSVDEASLTLCGASCWSTTLWLEHWSLPCAGGVQRLHGNIYLQIAQRPGNQKPKPAPSKLPLKQQREAASSFRWRGKATAGPRSSRPERHRGGCFWDARIHCWALQRRFKPNVKEGGCPLENSSVSTFHCQLTSFLHSPAASKCLYKGYWHLILCFWNKSFREQSNDGLEAFRVCCRLITSFIFSVFSCRSSFLQVCYGRTVCMFLSVTSFVFLSRYRPPPLQ